MRLDLTGASKKVPKSAIRKYIKLSQAKLTHVVLNNVFHADVAKILEWLSYCRNLAHLEIAVRCDGDEIYRRFHKCKSLKALITSADVPVTRACIFKLMKELPCLETIEIRRSMEKPEYGEAPERLPKIKKIVYGMQRADGIPLDLSMQRPHIGTFGVPILDPSEETNREQLIAEMAPALEELGLHFHPQYPKPGISLYLETVCFPTLRKLELSNFMLHSRWTFPPTLEHLAIRSCKRVDRRAMEYLPHQLRRLKTLILDSLEWLNGALLTSLLSDTDSTLETFELKHCFQISPGLLAEQVRTLKSLTSLHTCVLEGMYGLDDRGLGEIIWNMPSLKILSVPDTSVTGVLIKRVVSLREVKETQKDSSKEGTPRIEVLNLKGCSEVSIDAVEYGRHKGLRILT
jgi:F-box/TPR repeat protein Pof3